MLERCVHNILCFGAGNMKTDYRGQPLSADELLEENEEDEHEKEVKLITQVSG